MLPARLHVSAAPAVAVARPVVELELASRAFLVVVVVGRCYCAASHCCFDCVANADSSPCFVVVAAAAVVVVAVVAVVVVVRFE